MDNILDLITKGDFVELDIDCYHLFQVIEVKRVRILIKDLYREDEWTRKEYVKAIYKRQLNGDYKRYVVSEKI